MKNKNTPLTKKIINSCILIKKFSHLENKINLIIKKIYTKINSNNKVLICGNGGSAADAQHLAAEFLVRLNPKINRKPFPVIPLALDISTITACSNDYSFTKIFSRNLDAIGSKNDLLITLSTSGNSKNIIEVLKTSKRKKIFSISFLGSGGGIAKGMADLELLIPSKNTAHIQEGHMFLGHFIFNEVEKLLLKPLP